MGIQPFTALNLGHLSAAETRLHEHQLRRIRYTSSSSYCMHAACSGFHLPHRLTDRKKALLVVRSGGRMIKPCGLVCVAYPYALAALCPIASVALLVALCSPPRLSSRLCCHRRCLNLVCLHAPNTFLIASSHFPLTQAHVAFAIATACAPPRVRGQALLLPAPGRAA